MLTLTNATLASLWPRKLEPCNITIKHGRIMSLGSAPAPAGTEWIDCGGKLVVAGNVCAHTHLYSSLARGMPAPPRTPVSFTEILELVWWRLDRALDAESIRVSALIGALDAVRSGSTTLIDHHSSPCCIDGSLDMVAEALDEIGMRSVLCFEVTDRGGREQRDAGLRESERFLRKAGGRTRATVGGHASFTLEDDSLDALGDMARQYGSGVHIHVAEDKADEAACEASHRARVVERLDRHGIVQPRSILAHCIHIDTHEFQIAHRRQAWMVHNCRSNMNNSVGRAPIAQFGPRSALGTDGIDGDMFAESRSAFWRARESDGSVTADDIASMLARGGLLASEFFGFPIGSLEIGGAADLVVLDYDPPTPLTAGNLAWHWMFGLSAACVESVMVDGSWLVRDRACVTVDEEKIRAEARLTAKRLWERMEAL